ncbi:MAG: sugar phosphate isomerase/epimerase family protein [Planctomycetota bacterium]
MKSPIDRRSFLRASRLFLAGAAVPAVLGRTSPACAEGPEKRIRKAVGWGMIQENLSAEDKLRLVKDVGFEGVEVPAQLPERDGLEPQALARASEKVGVPVHGVTGSHADLPGAIDVAALYHATSVLCVVRADPNVPFMENYRRSQEVIRAAIPLAEKKRIPILVENVWATFLIEPLTMARYIDELDSPLVKAYFDVGNVMRWGWPHHWIEVLGKRIGKIHIKEYNLKVAMKEGMLNGFDFPLGQGDIDWKRVCDELKRIDYRGWATAEVRGGDRGRVADISSQMDGVLEF